jgi:serine protease Do
MVLTGILMGVLATTCSHAPTLDSAAPVRDAQAAPLPVLPAPALLKSGNMSMADVAKRAVPSVVNISATKLLRNRAAGPLFNDPFFRHFYGHRAPRMPQKRKQRALGSGVIVSADGVVLTNNHVVEHADEIQVTLSDGRDLSAKLVGSDPKSDVAVLRIEGNPKGLTPITIGSSAALRLGDVVLAIGNPFGVGQTVTMGIVSAVGRSRVGIADYEDFIQTDAAINPGNSGGALVNMRGELVGINTAILSRTGGYQGIGFAIPADMARPIMKSLLRFGKVERGWLGVSIQDVTPGLASGLGLSVKKGVLISDVVDDSPAARAGLRRGDVVTALNGKPVRATGPFRNRIAALGPKGEAKLSLIREGTSKTVTVTLGSLAKSASVAAKTEADKGPLAGVGVSNLTGEVRRKHDIDPNLKRGVVITSVERGSRAEQVGLQPGDVILEINRKRVGSVAEFRRTYNAKAAAVVLLVQRGDTTIYVSLR